jgi:hypothetical protein
MFQCSHKKIVIYVHEGFSVLVGSSEVEEHAQVVLLSKKPTRTSTLKWCNVRNNPGIF